MLFHSKLSMGRTKYQNFEADLRFFCDRREKIFENFSEILTYFFSKSTKLVFRALSKPNKDFLDKMCCTSGFYEMARRPLFENFLCRSADMHVVK